MSAAPIPRPPGVWRALARDGVLNPEEEAARAAVVVACTRPEPPPAPPAPPPRDCAGDPPQKRLAPFQSLLDRAAWTVRVTAAPDRARLEAFHEDGAAVMVTAVRGRKVNAYVLPAAQKRMPRWRVVAPADLELFVVRRQVLAPRVPTSRCTCEKRPYPTEPRAKAAIVDVTIRRVVQRRGVQSERRAYRCPDDDRVWHLTHIETWYGEQKPERQKGSTK